MLPVAEQALRGLVEEHEHAGAGGRGSSSSSSSGSSSDDDEEPGHAGAGGPRAEGLGCHPREHQPAGDLTAAAKSGGLGIVRPGGRRRDAANKGGNGGGGDAGMRDAMHGEAVVRRKRTTPKITEL